MSLLLFALALALPAGSDWFYPGPGDEIVRIERGETTLMIGGLPVERSGWLLAHADDPAALRAVPDVAEVIVLPGTGHVARVRPAAHTDEIALSRLLHARRDVKWAHPDFIVELVPAALPNDPYVRDEWHLSNIGQRGATPGVDIHAELAWTRTHGEGGLVAVIDTGVESKHPDLKVRLGHDYVGHDEDSNPDLVKDKDGAPHGTAVAGTAAATGDNGIGVAGVAWGSSIYAIRFIGGPTTWSDFYNAFVEAVDAGAWVLNNSWGFNNKCKPIPEVAVFHDAMDYAETRGRRGLGAAVVFATGNENCDISDNSLLAQPEVIGVGATGPTDRREDYSNYGVHTDVTAPSGTILTTDMTGKDGYGDWKGDANYQGNFNGTSAATPVVSGTLLLMFAANPRLTAAQARRVLCDTAAKVDIANGQYNDEGFSPYYGCGRIDAGAAVAAVANTAPPAPMIVGPRKQASPDHVVLEWQPVKDPDGDWVDYRVTWQLDGASTDHIVEVPGGTTHLDITREVQLGDHIVFAVQAADIWGPGPVSAPGEFTVVERPMAPPAPPMIDMGCQCDVGNRGRPGGVGGILIGILAALGRRIRRGVIRSLPR